MNTQIEPVESALAVIGVRPIISKEVEKFTKAHLDESTKLPNQIERMARQLCRDELIDLPLFTTSYDRTLKDLYEEWQPQQAEAMAKALAKYVAHLDVGLMAKGKEVIDFLRSIFPRASYTTFLGAANVVPSDVAIYSFESILEVLENPLRVFPLIQQGAVTKKQVAAMRYVYPTISAAIDEALIDTVTSAKVAKASYELPPAAEMGVARWFGQPAISPKTAAQLQAVAAKPEETESPTPAAKRPKSSVLAKESLSSAQRAALGPLK